jgi:hypothetical protein
MAPYEIVEEGVVGDVYRARIRVTGPAMPAEGHPVDVLVSALDVAEGQTQRDALLARCQHVADECAGNFQARAALAAFAPP